MSLLRKKSIVFELSCKIKMKSTTNGSNVYYELPDKTTYALVRVSEVRPSHLHTQDARFV